jgi:alkaline phosphatase
MTKKNTNKGLSRKDFLKTSAAASALIGGAGFLAGGCTFGVKTNPGDAKNVIFLISDGMSIGTLTSADMTMRRKLGRVSNWIGLYENNKCRRSLMDVTQLDAIGVVLKFREENPDTHVITTTDHGHVSPTLNRSINGYDETEIGFDRFQNFKYKMTGQYMGLGEESSVNYFRERVEEASNSSITSEQASALQQASRGERMALYEMMSPPDAMPGPVLANYISVNWTGSSHTGDYVQLAALGPGSKNL